MISGTPLPFAEAIAAQDVKTILTTTGDYAALTRLKGPILRRSMVSATVAVAEPLQKLYDGVGAIVRGEADQASVRLSIKNVWESLGYRPDPEKAGGIQDLSSSLRTNLQIETNVAVARGAGWQEQGMQPDVLDEYPARELYDTRPGGEHRRAWEEIGAKLGGKFPDGRMVALVTDPIWEQLGNPENTPGGLGNPFAPFALNSFWRTRDVDRDKCIALGLIDADTQLTPEPLDLTGDLEKSPALREDWLREAIDKAGVGYFGDDGVLHFTGGDK